MNRISIAFVIRSIDSTRSFDLFVSLIVRYPLG